MIDIQTEKYTKKIYLEKLDELSSCIESVPDTPMGMYLKVINLVTLNIRYEKIAFDKNLKEHPFVLVRKLIEDQIISFSSFKDILFIESAENKKIAVVDEDMEDKHHDLWNALWNKYDPAAYEEKVDRYKHRIRINKLEPLIKDKACVDLGTGHGTFAFALAELGAKSVAGIDFGEDSIAFSAKVRETRPSKNKTSFQVASIYKLPFKDDTFDFAVQNGVFHHMHDEGKAISETRRILKKGGYFWYYTDGEGGISYDLWDRSVHLLRNVPIELIQSITKSMNVSTNKSYHLGDGLKATYRHTSWKKITDDLSKKGFGNFVRMQGGFDTDLDGEAFKGDPYAKEKFGEGDLRVLAQLLVK